MNIKWAQTIRQLEINQPEPGPRFPALDIAGFLAAAGMIAPHLWPLDLSSQMMIINGYATALSAILGGCTATLSTRRLRSTGHFRAARLSLVIRGLMIIAVGAALLTATPTYISTVLISYGVALMLATLLITLPPLRVFGIAAVLATFGTWLTAGVAAWLELTESTLDLSSVPAALGSVFATGPYSVMTLLAYISIGMAFCKLLLRAHTEDRIVPWSLRSTSIAAASFGTALATGMWYLWTVITPRRAANADTDASASFTASPYLLPHNVLAPHRPLLGWDRVFSPATRSGSLPDIVATSAGSILVILALTLSLHLANKTLHRLAIPRPQEPPRAAHTDTPAKQR